MGFSLIELMIVLAIMMSLIGLVGGGVIGAIDRARAQTEVIGLHQLLKKAGIKAFSTGQNVVLIFDKTTVRVSFRSTGLDKIIVFEHLSFKPNKITFFKNGVPDATSLAFAVRGRDRQLDFTSAFGAAPQK